MTAGLRRLARAASVLVVAGAAAVALAGCSTSGEGQAAVPAPDELVGRWVTGVEYESPEIPFLLIDADGTWTGSDGCNGTMGTWSIDDEGVLDVTAGPSTLIYCDAANLPSLFASAHVASVDSGRLRFFDDEGATTVKLSRSTSTEAPDAEPIDPGNTAGLFATWGGPAGVDSGAPTLTISDDGTVAGSDGCNGFTGTWEVSGTDAIRIRVDSHTEIGCDGNWLLNTRIAALHGGGIMLFDATGMSIGTLDRAV